SEDTLALYTEPGAAIPAIGRERLTVAAVAFPRVSNTTDVDAFAQEPGVDVRWTVQPGDVSAADLVVLPGTRATVHDLEWARRTGLAQAVVDRAAKGRPVLGLCGGYQMLCRTITDSVESDAGEVAGLGLLPADVTFATVKTLTRPLGEHYGAKISTGYEIHHGVAHVDDGTPTFLEGARCGAVWGTHWHGAFDSDEFRRAFLTEVAQVAGRDFVPASDTNVAALRAARLDVLGDAVADHLDTIALAELISEGAPAGLPFLPPGAP
ncbi:MAG: cobyric acid synthase CobQ, partial [Gordonia polyisoprenivorans]|nr:cobyric acid synthase CobQ [Gordonia polyisoprenivorans]